jgi:hypothetical protein
MNLRKYFADFYYLPQESEEYKESHLPSFNTKLPSSFVKITGINSLIQMNLSSFYLLIRNLLVKRLNALLRQKLMMDTLI